MKIVSIAEIKANLEDYLKSPPNEPIAIVEGDRPIAAMSLIVDPEDLERFLLANNWKFNQILEESRRSLQEEGGIKQDDFWQLVEQLPTND
ncbi:MAG: type II toxin-antitoxin system Phd/YefM family antitoxin [Hormoscilla sp. GUM202]|nr:type II toxin-antitoxin system Phd/YefM family antitoxin [Hormoscilla sp. GUM202]